MTKRFGTLAAILLVGCGGGEPSGEPSDTPAAEPAPAAASPTSMPAPPTGAPTIPEWYVVDHDARTVSVTVTAGSTNVNNHWNFNGLVRGAAQIVVPVGYTITMELVNQDPFMAHSMGVQADFTNPALPPTPAPVFEGAITPNPTSMVDGTLSGQSATIEFVADTAGDYTLLCYVPGHTATGMWLYFQVSEGGEAGVRGL